MSDKQKDLIREVFLRNGFTIKDGRDDLADYVYEAAHDLLQAVQGEPVAWSGWGCQHPGKMPRLYGDRRIAELNCDWENGDQVLYFTAAQQQPECGCCGQTVKCDPDCDAVVIGGHRPAEQQPSPDVAGLVEIAKEIVDLHDKRGVVLTVHVEALREALAAYRKQGGES